MECIKRVFSRQRGPGVVFAGLAACLLLTSCSQIAVKPEPADFDLKVMTFNIRYGSANDGPNHWRKRRQLVFDVITDSDADVIGLQEAMKFQIDQILESAPEYRSVGLGRDDGKEKGEFSNILYNTHRYRLDESDTFWLSDTPDLPGSITWGNACTRICSWARLVRKNTGRAFYVYNLHLDHISQPSREKSAVLVAHKISRRTQPNDPFVLTGDFNAGENNAAILYLKGKASPPGIDTSPIVMVDSFRTLHPQAEPVGTFNGFKGKNNGDKIDYIFVGPKTRVLATEILRTNVEGSYPSDHFPITAILQWDEN
jgi:endonuclease/exonuclease/phosphatase family metal-dependent hydrolase